MQSVCKEKMKKKWMGLISACILITAIFSAVFYIAKEADHHCIGDDCPICATIHTAQAYLVAAGHGDVVKKASPTLLILPRNWHSADHICPTAFSRNSSLILAKIRCNS
jgi:hypothetical protein